MAVLTTPQIPASNAPIADTGGIVQLVWRRFFELLSSGFTAVVSELNTIPGVNVLTVAQLNALGLGAGDAGYVARATDTNHLVTWTGTAWTLFDGDAAGRIEGFITAPPNDSWALCDGSGTTILQTGATLVLTSVTTPLLTAGAYLKAGGSYTGAVSGKSGTTTSDVTSSDNQHNHNIVGGTSTVVMTIPTSVITVQSGAGASVADSFHKHSLSGHDDDVPAHSHTVPALGVGSIDMEHLTVLPYLRR